MSEGSVSRTLVSHRVDATPATLELDGVTVKYGEAVGVRRVNLKVEPGEAVMLIGANGVGKTTVLRAVAGFMSRYEGRITEGQILLDGSALGGLGPDGRVRIGIRLVPEREKVFATLSVEQNLELFARGSLTDDRVSAVWEYFPLLKALRNRKAGMLSGGERQLLALTVAVLGDPRLLLIDEMSLGLAPATLLRAAEVVKQLQHDRGFSLLLAEQNRTITHISDRLLQLTDQGIVT
jgi:branched-chain amino acid transport system ATP-binding protein